MITTDVKWFKPEEKLPEEEGWYLISRDDRLMSLEVLEFAPDLNKFDPGFFPGEGYSRPGFFRSDDDGWYHEVKTDFISYWAEMPIIKEEN